MMLKQTGCSSGTGAAALDTVRNIAAAASTGIVEPDTGCCQHTPFHCILLESAVAETVGNLNL